MVNLSQIAPLDMNSAFLPDDAFRSFADLDGAHAAAFELEGCYVLLSHHSVLTPAAARLVDRLRSAEA